MEGGRAKGKVFAIASQWDGPSLDITFKVSQLTFDLLKDEPGMRPAPYLASRGLLWLQRRTPETVDDAALKDYLRESHRLAALNLPVRTQRALGSQSKVSAPGKRASDLLPQPGERCEIAHPFIVDALGGGDDAAR